MAEQFHVGQTVFVWAEKRWAKVRHIEPGQLYFHDLPRSCNPESCTANPVIPPKPKKVVTKEAICLGDSSTGLDGHRLPSVASFKIPRCATNIRCLYDTEEDA